MLFTILVWAYITILCYLYGHALLAVAIMFFDLSEGPAPAPVFICLLGLAAIASLAGLVSIFMRLSWEVNLLFAIGGLGIGIWQKEALLGQAGEYLKAARRGWPFLVLAAALVVFVVIWMRSIREPLNYDTGLYHAQAIRWMEEYPLPPGLGNLHDRLAFNSHWLLLSAVFSLAFLGIGSFHLLGGWLAALAALEFLSRARRLIVGEGLVSDLIALGLAFALRRLLSLEFSSPGTDLPAAILIWLVVVLFFERVELGAWTKWDPQGAAVFFLSLFALTVKLNTLPLLILPAAWLLQPVQQLNRRVLAGAAAVIFLIGPWLLRNGLLSGYLIYPLTFLDLLSVPWKIPFDKALDAANWIRSWARVPGRHQSEVLTLSFTQWLPLWYQALDGVDRMLLFLGAGGGVFFTGSGLWLYWRKKLLLAKADWLVYLTIVAGCLFWFTQAPAPRFGYGFLALLALVGLVPLGRLVLRRRKLIRVLTVIFLLLFLAYQGVGLNSSIRETSFPARLFFPLTYPETAAHLETNAGFVVNIPDSGDQCWYAPFPCTPRVEEGLRLRGGSLADGFLP